MQVGERTFEVGRDVAIGACGVAGLQPAHEACLGGDVQQAGARGAEVGFAREVKPQQTVAFERETARTEGIGARRDVAVGQEAAEAAAAHGARYAPAPQQERDQGHAPSDEALEQRTRHVVERPADQSFHGATVPGFFSPPPRSGAASSGTGRSSRWRAVPRRPACPPPSLRCGSVRGCVRSRPTLRCN